MALTYEDALRFVRDSIATSEITENPATFEPPPWAIRAVERAYQAGHADGERFRQAAIDSGRMGASLYPEGG